MSIAPLQSESGPLESRSDNDGDLKDIRFAYRASTWSNNHLSYDPPPLAFNDDNMIDRKINEMPTYLQILFKF